LANARSRSAVAAEELSEFGRRVRTARRDRAMTQGDLAGEEISAAYVSRIEAGQRRPEPAVARLLAERLGTTVEYLLTGIEPQTAEEMRLAVRYAELALKSGEAAEAEAQLRVLLESGELVGALADEVTWLLALSCEALGRLDVAVELLEQLATQPAAGRAVAVATALARCYRVSGDPTHAIEVGERVRARLHDDGLDGTDDDIRLIMTLVDAYQEQGDDSHAAQLCREAISRAEPAASLPARAAAYRNASVLAAGRAGLGEAITLAERALALLSQGEDDRNLARLRTALGVLCLRSDDPRTEDAAAHLERAFVDLQNCDGKPVDIARCQLGLAQAAMMSGKPDRAFDAATQAVETVGTSEPFLTAQAEVVLGRVEVDRGNRKCAGRHFRHAAEALGSVPSDRDTAQLWYELGELLETAGDDAAALDAFRNAAASVGLRSFARPRAVV
jgi:tetratricopeptide (TPR) repeat protein